MAKNLFLQLIFIKRVPSGGWPREVRTMISRLVHTNSGHVALCRPLSLACMQEYTLIACSVVATNAHDPPYTTHLKSIFCHNICI